jgi:cardiolipin synthase A/B
MGYLGICSYRINQVEEPWRDTVMLLDGGSEAFPRMWAAIDAAMETVHLEVYTFARDRVGEHFLQALATAAGRGVRVTVIIDGWGSALDGRSIARQLEAAGCTVQIYNPLMALFLGRFRRDHRKILLVDGQIAFLGGINIAEEYGGTDQAGSTGEAAHSPPWLDLGLEVRGSAAAWLGRRLRGGREKQPPSPTRIYLSGIGGGRPLRQRYLKAIGAARFEIWVAHGYFLPDRRFVRSLTAAARRGVKVRLLLAGRSDVVFARAATMRLYRQLLRAGVKIYEWTRSVHHAKAAVVDAALLLAGSFNLDPLSLANLEALVEVDDPAVAGSGRRWIEVHADQSRRVTLQDLAGRTPLQRFLLDVVGLWAARAAQGLRRLLAIRGR